MSIARITSGLLVLGLAGGGVASCKDWDDPEAVEEHQEEAKDEREEIQEALRERRAKEGEEHAEEVEQIRENIQEEREKDLADDRAEIRELKEDMKKEAKPKLDGEGAGPDNQALEAIRTPSPTNRDELD